MRVSERHSPNQTPTGPVDHYRLEYQFMNSITLQLLKEKELATALFKIGSLWYNAFANYQTLYRHYLPE